MNTPSHALLGGALLGRRNGARMGWVVFFSALPDFPIYLFYLWEKWAVRAPEAQIWNHDYFVSAWQPVIDALHSFPLILLALLLCWRFPPGKFAALALLLHSLGDFPLHHEDAHRHFFPVSDWRFRSPVSYWDPAYHGVLGASLEVTLALGAIFFLARRAGPRARWALGGAALLYIALYAVILQHACASPLFHPRLRLCFGP